MTDSRDREANDSIALFIRLDFNAVTALSQIGNRKSDEFPLPSWLTGYYAGMNQCSKWSAQHFQPLQKVGYYCLTRDTICTGLMKRNAKISSDVVKTM